MAAKTINFANFKGGVGKTMTGILTARWFSKFGFKVLFIDLDPQANATSILLRSTGIEDFERSLYEGIKAGDITNCIVPTIENLDLIPSDLDLVGLPIFLNDTVKGNIKSRAYLLDHLIEPLRNDYDFIFIDTPPTISDFTNNAVVAADYAALVMQTQDWSFKATQQFIPYLQEMIHAYETDIDLLGVIPLLIESRSPSDISVFNRAKEEYGEYLMKSAIYHRRRIKTFTRKGITDNDRHDKDALYMYKRLAKEMLERMGYDGPFGETTSEQDNEGK